MCFSGQLDWFGGILAIAILTFWGLIAARFSAPIFGSRFGDSFYAPKVYLKTAPEIISPIKGLITRAEYDEAIERLNELLEEKPFSPEPYLLLVELYANELDNYLRAMEMVEDYFKQRKVYPFEENIDMLLLYADICQERNYLKKAEALLAREAARKSYPEIKRKALETRLEAIAS
jgi:tetratricopeptide (TPR) repeat protein